ncbi:hypothetical protein [Dongia sp.]|uniref:hypothetical protein n=1 Tax=Dongia sp. TaxID=1977262 RepID=UPI00375024FE
MADRNLLDLPFLGPAMAKVALFGTETERTYALLAVAIDTMRRAREQIRAGDSKAADAALSEILNAHDLVLAPKNGKEH